MEVNVIKENVLALDCHENCNMVIDYLVNCVITDDEIRERIIDYAEEKFEDYTLVRLLQMGQFDFYNEMCLKLATDIVRYLSNMEYKVFGCYKVGTIVNSCDLGNLETALAEEVTLVSLWDTYYNLNNGGEVIDNSDFIYALEGFTEELIDNDELIDEEEKESEEEEEEEKTPEGRTYITLGFIVRTSYNYGDEELKRRFMNRIHYHLNPMDILYDAREVDNGYDVDLYFELDGVFSLNEVIELINYRFGSTCPRKWPACSLISADCKTRQTIIY